MTKFMAGFVQSYNVAPENASRLALFLPGKSKLFCFMERPLPKQHHDRSPRPANDAVPVVLQLVSGLLPAKMPEAVAIAWAVNLYQQQAD
jgi:hypothetical protein